MTNRIGFTNLSKHAKARLDERTSLLETELIPMLNNNCYYNLGVEIGFYRRHSLFYSIKDDQYYVAVQDTKTGTVITILTWEYHMTLSWKLEKTCLIIDDGILRRTKFLAKYNMNNNDIPSKISLKIRYIDQYDDLKIELVKKFNADVFSYNPLELTQNNQKILNIIRRWKKKKSIHEIVDIYSSMGRKSTPYFVENCVVDKLNYS
jgi:hypothetical protein